MYSWTKTLVSVLAAFFFGGALFAAGLVLGATDEGPVHIFGSDGSDDEVLEEALATIITRSTKPPDQGELETGSVRGMVDVLKETDDYARFYTPENYQDFLDYAAGSFEGIGVLLGERKQDFVVLTVLPSTPAEEVGLKPGDAITHVNGNSVKGLSSEEVVGRVKGPDGTEVTLTVERDNRSLEFDITRAAIDLPNVTGKLIRGHVGFVRLFGFGRGAGDQLRQEIQKLLDRGATGLVLDMRDNGGGLFSESIEVASAFIEDGEIVSFKERGSPEVEYDAEGDAFDQVPLVVLVNGNSASATEIVAGALKAEDRAELVGQTTFGKGSVQEVVPLSDDSAIKMTTGAYFTPDGESIEGVGVVPDVSVKGAKEQRERALDVLEDELAG
jgi:carboxyl-terminal processing protease